MVSPLCIHQGVVELETITQRSQLVKMQRTTYHGMPISIGCICNPAAEGKVQAASQIRDIKMVGTGGTGQLL